MSDVDDEHDGRHDFDFLIGPWRVHHRVLRARLANSEEWREYDATSVARPVLGGLGNVDEYADADGGFVGMALRVFRPDSRTWAIYWVSTRLLGGALDPPMVGSFTDGTGVFHGKDPLDGRDVLVRFIWSGVTTPTPRWEQALSEDGGATWATNWIMDFERAEAS